MTSNEITFLFICGANLHHLLHRRNGFHRHLRIHLHRKNGNLRMNLRRKNRLNGIRRMNCRMKYVNRYTCLRTNLNCAKLFVSIVPLRSWSVNRSNERLNLLSGWSIPLCLSSEMQSMPLSGMWFRLMLSNGYLMPASCVKLSLSARSNGLLKPLSDLLCFVQRVRSVPFDHLIDLPNCGLYYRTCYERYSLRELPNRLAPNVPSNLRLGLFLHPDACLRYEF